jgi:hypothetical protein
MVIINIFIFENKMDIFRIFYSCTMDKKLSCDSAKNKILVFILSLTTYFVRSYNQFLNQTEYNKNCSIQSHIF